MPALCESPPVSESLPVSDAHIWKLFHAGFVINLPPEFLFYNQCALRKVVFDTPAKKNFSVSREREGRRRAVSGRHPRSRADVRGGSKIACAFVPCRSAGLGEEGKTFQHGYAYPASISNLPLTEPYFLGRSRSITLRRSAGRETRNGFGAGGASASTTSRAKGFIHRIRSLNHCVQESSSREVRSTKWAPPTGWTLTDRLHQTFGR